MSRNEITLQEMFSSVIGELRESGRWGTAHIYQSTVNAFSAFTKWQPMSMCKLSPTVLKRFENFLRQRNCSWNTVSTYIKAIRSVYNQAVDRKLVRYVPRLFEHVYTGTRADRKKALEAFDIGSLVRETEMSLQTDNSPNTRQKTKIFFVLMFMLRGIPFVDLAYLHKRDLQGNTLSYRRRKTGRALTVSLTPEAMQMVRMVADR
ncbi:site-specific integrase, partial [Bacteroides uniformis]